MRAQKALFHIFSMGIVRDIVPPIIGEGEGEEGGEISPMCESIGHQPFGAAAQKGTDRPTNRPTDRHSGVKSRVARD